MRKEEILRRKRSQILAIIAVLGVHFILILSLLIGPDARIEKRSNRIKKNRIKIFDSTAYQQDVYAGISQNRP